ncbi:MAG: hypothetical protein M3O20_17660 [Acidobacteriota bacterium]|nr:hypothetical protein [Acidobacteriota bacterium]
MVPAVPRRRLPWLRLVACLTAAVALRAQDPGAKSLPALQEAAAKRTAEWIALTTGLEPRLVRLLPCDARVRSSIEEVAKAADSHTLALTSYWNMASIQSKAQLDAVRALLAREEGRGEDWPKEKAEAALELAATSAQADTLKASIKQMPALANPQKDLEALAATDRLLADQAQDRATGGSLLLTAVRDLLKASEARQSSIDEHLKSVTAEGQRWSAYYAARQARAQIECFLVNPSAATTPPAARPTPPPAPARPLPPGSKP